MLSFILRFILTVIATSAILFMTAKYGANSFGFNIIPLELSNIGGLLFMGFVFWMLYAIIARILKFFTFPLRRLTLGASNIVINVGVFYLFQYIVNEEIEVGYTIALGTIGQTVILSVLLAIITTIIYFIIKKLV